MNTLYYGDNLKILREYIKDESVATIPMLEEAVGAGFYHSPGWNKDYPKIQILTVEELLPGKTVQLPPNLQTFKQAAKIGQKSDDQGMFTFE
jgi:hypothetical protein